MSQIYRGILINLTTLTLTYITAATVNTGWLKCSMTSQLWADSTVDNSVRLYVACASAFLYFLCCPSVPLNTLILLLLPQFIPMYLLFHYFWIVFLTLFCLFSLILPLLSHPPLSPSLYSCISLRFFRSGVQDVRSRGGSTTRIWTLRW